MCEIIMRLVSKTHPDLWWDVKQTKRGDVIEVQADGWPWQERDLSNPDWALLKLPNVSVEFARQFLAAETGDPLINPYLQRKRSYIDIDTKVPSALRDTINATRLLVSNITEAQLLSFITVRDPVPDPEQI